MKSEFVCRKCKVTLKTLYNRNQHEEACDGHPSLYACCYCSDKYTKKRTRDKHQKKVNKLFEYHLNKRKKFKYSKHKNLHNFILYLILYISNSV